MKSRNGTRLAVLAMATVVAASILAACAQLPQPIPELHFQAQGSEVLAAFDAWVVDGSLVGTGPAKSANNRLKTFRNRLVSAQQYVATGDDASACRQLADTQQRIHTSGSILASHFVTGSRSMNLWMWLEQWRAELGCAGVTMWPSTLDAGFFFSLAVTADGQLWTWGNNHYGELGIGDDSILDSTAPVAVPGLSSVRSSVAGGTHAVALASDGTIWQWGFTRYYQLDDGSSELSLIRYAPERIQGLNEVVSIAAGGNHVLALRSDGTVWAWGNNTRGELGDGTTTSRRNPVQVVGLTDVVSIAAGGDHSLALRRDGTVWAWGYNTYGQLGDGSTTTRLTPVKVPGLKDVTSMAASIGGGSSFAVTRDGKLWAWGANDGGLLGDGTTITRLSPVHVASLSQVTSVAAGSRHTLALTSDGTVWSWGYNFYGELGDGTTDNRLTPAPLIGLDPIMRLAAGYEHSLALTSDGQVWAWGYNGAGQLGDGTRTSRSSPVPSLMSNVRLP